MSAAVVSALRARPEVVRLPGSASGGEPIVVRVQIPEVWDVVRIEGHPTTSVLEIKRRAMAELLGDKSEAQEFVTKFRGNEILNESVSLAEAAVRSGSTLLVTSRRRRPVR